MNRSHFEHAGYALLFQFIIGLSTGNWWAGAAFGAAFFLGREHAQAANRAGGTYQAFKPSAWNLDSILDFVAPLVAVVCVAWYAGA